MNSQEEISNVAGVCEWFSHVADDFITQLRWELQCGRQTVKRLFGDFDEAQNFTISFSVEYLYLCNRSVLFCWIPWTSFVHSWDGLLVLRYLIASEFLRSICLRSDGKHCYDYYRICSWLVKLSKWLCLKDWYISVIVVY